jgi:ubiquinone/menaquinone biosynthesis C-methylase UbiE
MKLCVGCGTRAEGDVNVDFDLGTKMRGQPINAKIISNFVLADASQLPFREDSFSLVVARHVLEHLPEPLKALREWRRVSTDAVEVYVPSQYYCEPSEPNHLFSWNRDSLNNLMRQVFSHVDAHYTSPAFENIEHNYKTALVNLYSRLFGFWIQIKAVGYV